MTDDGDIATKCPTELAITERRENEFSRLGFIPICYYKGTDRAVFMAAQSCNKPKQFMDPDATGNASLSAQLQYTLAAGRFAHFLKVIMRDKVGSFMSKDDCQDYLNKWIANYVLLDDRATQEAKARHPLREADVQVSEIAGKPGWYSAVAYLRPHFQLEGIKISLRWVTKVPKKG
jgi:type VI secretion system protein ImpC